eukprot:TRINITY_DN29927_c0_g1_i1.p1 TRINITY_DN29927_c0_g1~~TRINITY_DN29927_c0_g1_i1.p1  ORF type:complete len:574 (-),score=137.19 TRINITY_DN29927_c0_g1_i1:99-1820(-)
MATWPVDCWSNIEAVVNNGRYMGANDEFNALKAAVLAARFEDIDAAANHADVTWTFLLGFAERKAMYRSHVAKVLYALIAVPSWRAAYEARSDLQVKAAALHTDLQAALNLKRDFPEPPVVSSGQKVAVVPADSAASVAWPDWRTIEAIVLMAEFARANDDFATLKDAVAKANPEQIDNQSSHAVIAWQFLIGFAQVKSAYRLHVAKVFQSLMAVPSWKDTFEAQADLQEKARLLHVDLQSTLGLSPRLETSDSAPPASVPEVSTAVVAEDDQPTVPRKRSTDLDLERRLAALDDAPGEPATPEPDPPAPAPEVKAQTNPPDPLVKLVQPYLQRAAELEGLEPVAAHYCRVYALELLLQARSEKRATDESNKLLFATLDAAEGKKDALDLSRGQTVMENFAFNSFESANAADVAATSAGAGGAGAAAVPALLYVAGLFLDVLAQFHAGVLPPELAAASQYAKRRAVHIRQSLQRGVEPSPAQPPSLRPPATVEEEPPPAPAAAAAPAAEVRTPAAVQLPSTPALDPSIAAMSAGKRKLEAKKKADLVLACLDTGDSAKACAHLREALAMLEGL